MLYSVDTITHVNYSSHLGSKISYPIKPPVTGEKIYRTAEFALKDVKHNYGVMLGQIIRGQNKLFMESRVVYTGAWLTEYVS